MLNVRQELYERQVDMSRHCVLNEADTGVYLLVWDEVWRKMGIQPNDLVCKDSKLLSV